MRELKFFVKGSKGNIEVTKGTYLSLQRKRNKKVSKKKIIVQTKGKQNKKLIIKQIKSDLKCSKSKEQFKLPKSIYLHKNEKQCPNTAQSIKNDETHVQDPATSEFCIFSENQIRNNKNEQIFQCKHNQQIIATQSFEPSLMTLKSESIIMDGDLQNEGQLQDCEDSSWSMINEHVQYMAMSLSLSVYDHLYGQNKLD